MFTFSLLDQKHLLFWQIWFHHSKLLKVKFGALTNLNM